MRRRLSSLLEAEGVTSFESVGQRFDPTRHEATATVRIVGGVPGTVVDAGPGYLWNEQPGEAWLERILEAPWRPAADPGKPNASSGEPP